MSAAEQTTPSATHASSDAPSVPEMSKSNDKERFAMQFENYAREWQQVSQQDTFDGFRMEATKTITPQLQAAHSLFLGTTMRPEGYLYQFGPAYSFDNNQSVALARMSTDGTVNARLVKHYGDNFDFRLNASSHLKEAERNMVELSAEHSGRETAIGLKASYQGAAIYTASLSQALTKKLQMGTELTYISAGASIASFGARWGDARSVAALQLTRAPQFSKGPLGFALSEHSLKASYYRKISDRLSLGCDIDCKTPDLESAMKIGYEYNFRQARVQGLLDTAGRASVFVQDFTGFGISGLADFYEGFYKFGLVMHIMPPQS